MYCDHCVCMFVQTSRNFLHMLPVAEARSSSDDNAINTLRTSRFVDDVMFSHKRDVNVVYNKTK